MKNPTALCPCQSGKHYQDCCEPLHRQQLPLTAEQLMRSRYSAYVLQRIDYIVQTTVPSQQSLLDQAALRQWAETTRWVGLQVLTHRADVDKSHSTVEFKAYFENAEGRQEHHEKSLFVKIGERWFFVDPSVPLPTMKQPCVCGSGKKFKHCCGGLL